MASTIRIKRRAAGGAAGAPASLANAELAFNEQDNTLYYGTGTGGAGGTATSVIPIAGSGAFVGLTGVQTVAGAKTFSSPITGSLTGNATTATTLQTARTINGTAFDGSANISISAPTPASLTAGSFLTGGPFNGSAAITLAVNAASLNTPSTVVARDSSGNFAAGTITAALTGNASTATTLATARNLAVSGDVTGTTTFNGGADATIAATLSSTGVAAGTYKSVTVDVKGRVTAGANPTTLAGFGITDAVSTSQLGAVNGVAQLGADGKVPTSQLPSYVDDVLEFAALANFPATGETGKIYVAIDTGLIYRWSGTVYVVISSAGAADTATRLTTPRTISATGDATWSVSFDGSANVTSALALAASGATAGTYGSTTQVGVVTVNAKGLVTSASNSAIAFPVTTVAGRTGAISLSTADVAGLGTMATQNANAVAITGGAIDGIAFDGGTF